MHSQPRQYVKWVVQTTGWALELVLPLKGIELRFQYLRARSVVTKST